MTKAEKGQQIAEILKKIGFTVQIVRQIGKNRRCCSLKRAVSAGVMNEQKLCAY